MPSSNLRPFGEAPNGAREARALPGPLVAPRLFASKASCPFSHLLGKRTLRAVGVVLQAKVLVDLKQTLLVRQCAEKLPPARIITKKPRGASFDTSIREAGRQFRILRPNIVPGELPERHDDVGLDIAQAGFPDERHRGWRRLGGERVMKVPVRMGKAEKKVSDRNGIELA